MLVRIAWYTNINTMDANPNVNVMLFNWSSLIICRRGGFCARTSQGARLPAGTSISGLLHASHTSLMPRPPPRSLQEYFYYLLVDSPAFNNWVRRIHARVNRLPYQAEHEPTKSMDALTYTPTRLHKMNAFRIIWVDELKRTFKIWWIIYILYINTLLLTITNY